MKNTTQQNTHLPAIQTQQHQTCFTLINPETLYDPSAFGYSHIVEVQNFNRIIHIAGQSGEDIQGHLSSDFTEQVQQTFKNLEHALHAVGGQFADIAVLKVLMVDHNTHKHDILIQHSQQYWSDSRFPVCTLIPVPCLAKPEMLIEIDATAYVL
ncbi:RidA family protein [Acinetobacter shaoyimingii]|uniref:RidA family protein n=1 Tax=Acinetobacter shaoyimingii TaxID=2715164 RepID=A0A6G8RSS8_9GAMM|nr:RidA family protein [Acinetobacter shaoyimingii]NHB56481.1 RidA family protein [Acinetobacter shaoyimingii]QIO05019.1 RidA family protein [Acinetobacter shaoyimingii]